MTSHEWNENMEIGVRYIVTKASDDGTFEVGDHILLCANGDITNQEAQGWIDKADVDGATCGMEVKVDTVWSERRRKMLLQKLATLDVECMEQSLSSIVKGMQWKS